MLNRKHTLLVLIAALGLSACADTPTGPNIAVMPGSNKTFEQFRFDDFECRQFAQQQNGIGTSESGFKSGATTAAIGTVVGAVAGAAIGGSKGAGVGAGVGLLGGTAAGAGSGQESSSTMQKRYDNSFMQCMYAKGHQVPIAGRLVSNPTPPASSSTPPPPPPPAGTPPAPPPGVNQSTPATK